MRHKLSKTCEWCLTWPDMEPVQYSLLYQHRKLHRIIGPVTSVKMIAISLHNMSRNSYGNREQDGIVSYRSYVCPIKFKILMISFLPVINRYFSIIHICLTITLPQRKCNLSGVWCKDNVKFRITDHAYYSSILPWCRHQMETFSALLAICAGNSPVPSEFSTQRPVTRSFDIFFDLRLNERLSKQWWDWWFETLSPHYDVTVMRITFPV